ncbi:hypothetical protein [uncultured Clostridium sp.]|uniref:hypothetical protein n=1 Tax=uncultured Clostridium sp. TaxID=59620 RepID=UPI003216E4CF
MERIELSEERIDQMFENGDAFTWAKNVFNKVELSEEEKVFSEVVNDMVNQAWKFGSTQAKESIAQLVGKIIEPEVFSMPNEILAQIFDEGSYGEFDQVRIQKSPKNTLIARQSAPRSGNVDKSYIDVAVGLAQEAHLQIETELKMSDLRRDGALGVATLTMFAIEEFNRSKFQAVLNHVDSLVTAGGENYFTVTGALTKTAVDDFTGYLDDYCFEGNPEVVGLSSKIRELCKVSGVADFYSEMMKNDLNNLSMLKVYNGSYLVPIKDGKKNGAGQTLLSKQRLFGFAGKIGQMYTKGEMRTLVTNDNNNETISLKFTGVEFGTFVDKLEKVAKIDIK